MESKLPYCKYPKGSEIHLHGLQLLQNQLPIAKLPKKESGIAIASELTKGQLEEMAQIVASSFALKEPMARHLTYKGPLLGTKDGLIRAFIINCLIPKKDVITQSIALLKNGCVVGGAFNETLILDSDYETSDIPVFLLPILKFLGSQQSEAIFHLVKKVEGFEKALQNKLIGHHLMIARGDEVTGDDTFELVTETIAHYRRLGFAFVITEATNAWTGAAFEILGGVRIHFSPYRVKKHLATCDSKGDYDPDGISPDGYLSDKDSGSMLYILRL